jgi:putative spermidine/putrescine transport system permease protein
MARGPCGPRSIAARTAHWWRAQLRSNAVLVALLPILLFLVAPTVVVVPMALTDGGYIQFPPNGLSFRHFATFIFDPSWEEAVVTSLKVVAIAVTIGLVAGTGAAIALHGTQFPGKGVLVAIVLTPIVIPAVVVAAADYVMFFRYHLVGTALGIGLAHGVLAVPYVFLSVSASLAGLNPALPRSVESLGGNKVAVLQHAYWPIIRSGLAVGAVFAFAASFDEAVIAVFMQGPEATTLPVKIFADIQYDFTPVVAAASSMVLTVAALLFTFQMAVTVRLRSLVPIGVSVPAPSDVGAK